MQEVYQDLTIDHLSPIEKYLELDRIVEKLHELHNRTPINIGTTGTISERLCQLAISSITAFEGNTRRYDSNWKWLGDFLLPGHPYDISVSVKSFKAKERLLASGTGSLLTPTIGWGLFNDPSEWGAERCASYLYRGFSSIYMPAYLLERLPSNSLAVKNINGKPLLRNYLSFPRDLENAVLPTINRIDIRQL